MIQDYERKMWAMLRRQKSVCCCCGALMRVSVYEGVFIDTLFGQKVDFCHDLPRTADNIRLFPLFIDSIENGGAGHNSCNTARKRLDWFNGIYEPRPFCTPHQAEQIEIILKYK